MLLPRCINLYSGQGYSDPNELAAIFSTRVYNEIISSIKEDLGQLSIRQPPSATTSVNTVVEFWMTSSDRTEKFPLFGDACFYNINKSKCWFAFSPGNRFYEMLRDGEKPFYAIANIKFKDEGKSRFFSQTKKAISERIVADPKKLEERLRSRGIML